MAAMQQHVRLPFLLLVVLSWTGLAVVHGRFHHHTAAFLVIPNKHVVRQQPQQWSSKSSFRHRRTSATVVSSSSSSSSSAVSSSSRSSSVEEATSTTTDASSSSSSSTKRLTLFSPCKINLFLRILRRRDDGYHDLASLFQAVGFGDTLELQLLENDDKENDDDDNDDDGGNNGGSKIVFSCNMEGVPVDSSNLVVRALQLIKDKTGRQDASFQANLIKQVPAQAGLGGGSANAATAMWGANELLGRPATLEQLVEWSGALGSDITFFLSRGTAYCTGRGEIMTPLDPPFGSSSSSSPSSNTKVCIVKFRNVGLSTPAVFKALDYNRLSTLDPNLMLQAFLLEHRDDDDHGDNDNISQVPSEYFINDLEYPAFTCVPQLAALKQELQAVDGFTTVMMSGSGTSIFCLGTPKDMEAFERQFVHDRRKSDDGDDNDDDDNDLQVFFTEFISRPEGVWFERPPDQQEPQQ